MVSASFSSYMKTICLISRPLLKTVLPCKGVGRSATRNGAKSTQACLGLKHKHGETNRCISFPAHLGTPPSPPRPPPPARTHGDRACMSIYVPHPTAPSPGLGGSLPLSKSLRLTLYPVTLLFPHPPPVLEARALTSRFGVLVEIMGAKAFPSPCSALPVVTFTKFYSPSPCPHTPSPRWLECWRCPQEWLV